MTPRMFAVPSAHVLRLGLDQERDELHVVFVHRQEHVYIYSAVDSHLFVQLLNAESVGQLLNDAVISRPTVHPFRTAALT